MQSVTENITTLFHSFSKEEIAAIEKLPQSGGDRVYFRIIAQTNSYIATVSENVKENNTFIQFTQHFKKSGAPVPEIFAINSSNTIYIQQDFGDVSLLNTLEKEGATEAVYALYQKSVRALAQLQILGDKNLNYDWCITSKEFGKQAIVADLLYFKYYLLRMILLFNTI